METTTRPGVRLRRVLTLTAAGALTMALLPAGAASADHAPEARDTDRICTSDDPDDYDSSFEDVGSGPHWVNIVCMADEGITEGVAPDGTDYAPRRDVTRGQMASFVVRFIEDATGTEMPPGDPTRFEDVPATDAEYTHATNIHKLAEQDIVRGTAASDGDEYAPQQHVNRMQMGTFIRHALSWMDDGEARNGSEPPEAEHDWFPDPSAPEHEDNVDAIAEVGIVEGFADGTYGPTETVRRDQMASYVMRAYDYAIEVGIDRPIVSDPDDPAEDGEVTGIVTDADTTDPIEGATVVLDNGEQFDATTGEDGAYTVEEVAPGEYTATADAEGYEPDSQTVTVADGQTVEDVDFALTAVVEDVRFEVAVTDVPEGAPEGAAACWDVTLINESGDDLPASRIYVPWINYWHDDDAEAEGEIRAIFGQVDETTWAEFDEVDDPTDGRPAEAWYAWGPEAGFEVPDDYEETTTVCLDAEPGTYDTDLILRDVDVDENYADQEQLFVVPDADDGNGTNG